MKLTKGKISKMYAKKRQTRRKYKKQHGGIKTKTFRRGRHLDLHKRTFKNMRGGGDCDDAFANMVADKVVEKLRQEPNLMVTAAQTQATA